jgi:hypothetical protein
VIPRILHRVVPTVVPPTFEAYWVRFRELHPGWELRTWADPLDPDEFESGRLFSECVSGAQLAGLVRLEIVHRYGGVYVDMDVEPLRSLEPLLGYECFIGTEDGRVLTDAVIGAVPGHPGIRACLDRAMAMPMTAGPWATGPGVVTAVLSQRSDVEVLPPRVFYPYSWTEPWRVGEDFAAQGAVAVHRWNASWTRGGSDAVTPVRARVERARRSVRRAIRSESKRALSSVKAAWSRLEPRTTSTTGTYVGRDRLILDTALELPVIAVASDLTSTPELVRTGDCDPPFRRFIARHVEPAARIVDVGADIGYFTLAAAKACGPHGHVFALEPNPGVVPVLRDNVRMNDFDRRVSIVPGEPAPLDELVGDVGRIALVKIDVGGRELGVLRGMSGLLERGAVSMIDVKLVDSVIANRSDDLYALLESIIGDHGASSWRINRDGTLEASPLHEICAHPGFSHVLLRFPGDDDVVTS